MKKRTYITIALGLLLVVTAVTAWAVLSGRLFVAIKEPSQSYVTRTFVCDDSVVSRYNDAVSASSSDEYASKLKAVFEDVDSKASKNDDPTCVFILYKYQLSQPNKAEEVARLASALVSLSDDGNYPSNKLIDIESIKSTEARAPIINSDASVGEDGGAG